MANAMTPAAGRALDARVAYPFIWRVRTRFPERFGQRCAVLVRSKRMNSALVAFPDGFRAVTSRNYVRKGPAGPAALTGEGA